MKVIKIGMPVFLILLGFVFFISSMNLPKAKLGNPNGPLYFPIVLSIMMVVFGVLYLFQELKTINKEHKNSKLLLSGRTPKLIGGTVLFGLVYAIIFERVGFLISTTLFLGSLLFLVNGKNKWKVNVTVAICFSFLSWYAFSQLLDVSLP